MLLGWISQALVILAVEPGVGDAFLGARLTAHWIRRRSSVVNPGIGDAFLGARASCPQRAEGP